MDAVLKVHVRTCVHKEAKCSLVPATVEKASLKGMLSSFVWLQQKSRELECSEDRTNQES
ncbi:hypothetical protein Ancab_009429, partial [Ancistrocladus abbreviatus]